MTPCPAVLVTHGPPRHNHHSSISAHFCLLSYLNNTRNCYLYCSSFATNRSAAKHSSASHEILQTHRNLTSAQAGNRLQKINFQRGCIPWLSGILCTSISSGCSFKLNMQTISSAGRKSLCAYYNYSYLLYISYILPWLIRRTKHESALSLGRGGDRQGNDFEK